MSKIVDDHILKMCYGYSMKKWEETGRSHQVSKIVDDLLPKLCYGNNMKSEQRT